MHATGYYGYLRAYRVARWFVYLAFLVPLSVYAQTQCTEYRWYVGATLNGPWGTSAASACAGSQAGFGTPQQCGGTSGGSSVSYKYTFKNVNAQYCVYETSCPSSNNNYVFDSYIPIETRAITCTQDCIAPTVRNSSTGVCEDPCAYTKGSPFMGEGCGNVECYIPVPTLASPAPDLCSPGGVYSPAGSGCVVSAKKTDSFCYDSKCYAVTPLPSGTGLSCALGTSSLGLTTIPSSTNPSVTKTITPIPPKGKCPGEINGVTVYVDCSSSTSSDTSTAGTKTTVVTTSTSSTSTTTNSTPGTRTDTSVTCSAGSCTLTTVVTDTSGTAAAGTATTTTQTGDMPGLCKQNPDASFCKNSTFSGSCATEFVCNGDAAMCAVARATNILKCSADIPVAGLDVLRKLDDGTFQPGLGTTTRSISQFETNGVLPTGSPANQTFSVAGKQFVIPLADVFSVLQMMGAVLVMFTTISCSLFVAKGFS